jgi:hypothetical protein
MSMQSSQHSREAGAVHPLLVSSIILGILAVIFAGFSIWAYTNYVDHRDNVASKVEAAVTTAKKEQSVADEKLYLEREKQPYTQFAGPDDLGHVTFSYPKTWSLYVAKNGSKGDGYEAYLNPLSVPAITNDQAYAARVVVSNDTYEDSLDDFESAVKKGDLKSAPITINGFKGIRLDGAFSKTRSGSAVVFKVRDKTLIISTDSEGFKGDFDNVIVKSLDFNP